MSNSPTSDVPYSAGELFSSLYVALLQSFFYAWVLFLFFFPQRSGILLKKIAIFGEITAAPLAGSYKTAWFRGSLQMGRDAGWRGMDVEVHPDLSGISWMASLLAADSYLLTAGPQAVSYPFLLINEEILIVQNIKDFLSFFPYLGIECSAPGAAGVKGVSTSVHSSICVPLQTRYVHIF